MPEVARWGALAAATAATGWALGALGLPSSYLFGALLCGIAAALGTGANAAFILAAQGLRLVVMVALAPVAVRWMVARRAGRAPSARA